MAIDPGVVGKYTDPSGVRQFIDDQRSREYLQGLISQGANIRQVAAQTFLIAAGALEGWSHLKKVQFAANKQGLDDIDDGPLKAMATSEALMGYAIRCRHRNHLINRLYLIGLLAGQRCDSPLALPEAINLVERLDHSPMSLV